MEIKLLSNVKTPEFVFIFYVFMLLFLSPLYGYIDSTIAIFLIMIFSFILNYIVCPKKDKIKLAYFFIFFSLFFIIFLINYINNNNYFFQQAFTRFIPIGLAPFWLLIDVKDYKLLFRFWCFFSFFTLIFYLPEMITLIFNPNLVFLYQKTGLYMVIGFNLLNYVFAGFLGNYYIFKKRWILPLIILLLIFITIYGNKSAAIVAVLMIFFSEWRKGKVAKKIYIFILSLFCVSYLNIIVNFSLDLIGKIGISTYSLWTFRTLFSNDNSSVTNLRTKIWREAYEYWLENPIFGKGIGVFEEMTGNSHAHNVFLEVLVTFGILGMFIFVSLIIISFYKIFKTKDKYLKVFQLMILASWLFQLQVSLVFWNSIFFWIYFAITLYPNNSNFIKLSDNYKLNYKEKKC